MVDRKLNRVLLQRKGEGGWYSLLFEGFVAVLFIEVSSFQGVLIRGVPAVLFIEVSSFRES